MAIYALGVLPLAKKLSTPNTPQVWFADDAAAGGSVHALHSYWDHLVQYGPAYGYHANSEKTRLVVKEFNLNEARVLFSDVYLW